jgi:hypothetical protein
MLSPAKEPAIREAIAQLATGEEVEELSLTSDLWFDRQAVHTWDGELAGAEQFHHDARQSNFA